ncbi:hypothetical protein B296_00045846 [Ensete ventricosum]|uniref:SPX domain-containing protein n=1 Tax=Ensete ventricosum TaxID=4639 RepID=A0A426YQU8_ENSVE|nr:hypothetical protein B296_00045846 [Ensete ventricosum]
MAVTVEGEPESPSAGTEERDSLSDEVIATLERNGVSFLGSGKAKAKKAGKLRTATSLRIDIPPTTPARAISMVWEDLVNSSRKEGSVGGDYINRKKLQRAEKMIREAFVQLYRGLDLLTTYRCVIKLADEVESIFTKHFAGDDRKRAMKFLRPQKPRESHTITFFVGTYPSFPQISIEVSASSPDAHTYGAFNALRVYLISMATVKICTHDIRVR